MLFSCTPAAAHAMRVVAKKARGPRRPFTVDIHCHAHTEAAAELVESAVPAEKRPSGRLANPLTIEIGRKQDERVHPQLTSVERRLRDMDRMGIDIQAVSTSPGQYYYWTEPEVGREAARLINDNIAAIVAGHPDRFVGLGTVPLQAPALAVAELERLVKDLGLRGIEIGTNVAGADLSAERFRPVFAKAQELDILVFMHPFGFNLGQRTADHYLTNVIGNPLESTIAVHHLIFGGVLDAYPRLKVVVAHGGGFAAAYSGRMDHAHRARPDCRTVIKKKPTSYLKKLYFDTMIFTHHQLEYLAQQYGSDHVLLGTDYPYDMGDEDPVGFIGGSRRLTRADKAAIMGGNAARLLKIRLPKTAAAAKNRPAARRPARKGARARS